MKKKSIMMTSIAIIVLVIALIISLVFVFNHNDTKAYNSKLEQAQKYVSKLDYKKAEDAYLEAIDIDPKQATAYNELADLYMNNGEEEKAVSILKKGSENINNSTAKKQLKDKQKEMSSERVINNGGEYVAYKGKSYYWKYTPDSFEGYSMKTDKENKLICVDKNGNKKTIYSGVGNGEIWIFKNKIYFNVYDDSEDTIMFNSFSLNLDGSNIQKLESIWIDRVCNTGLIIRNLKEMYYGIFDGNSFKTIENFEGVFSVISAYQDENDIYYFINHYSEQEITGITLKSMNLNNNKIETLANFSISDYVQNTTFSSMLPNNFQLIDGTLYFKLTCEYKTSDMEDDDLKSFSKIYKINKDGTNLETVKDIKPYTSFAVYKDKDGKDTLKFGGCINDPFTEDDEDSEKSTVYMYYEDSSTRKKLLEPNEYKKYGKELHDLRYDADNLYFAVSDEDEDDELTSYTYCIKNLKTNKITVYQQIKF